MLEKGHFALFVFLCLAAFGHFIFLYSFCKVLSAFDVCHRAGRGRIGDAAILISIFSIFSSFKGLTARSIDEHIDPSETSHDGQVFPRFPDATPQRTSRFLFFFHLAKPHAVKLHLHPMQHRLEKLRTWSTRLRWKGLRGITVTFASYICHVILSWHIMAYHVIYHVMTLMYSFNTHSRFSISTSKFALVGDSRCLGAVQRPQGEKKQTNENDAWPNRCDNVHPALNRLMILMDISGVTILRFLGQDHRHMEEARRLVLKVGGGREIYCSHKVALRWGFCHLQSLQASQKCTYDTRVHMYMDTWQIDIDMRA